MFWFSKANSMEFDTSTPDPVISLMEEQKNVVEKGGTMRLGAWKCALKPVQNWLKFMVQKYFRASPSQI
jgi:CTP synthase (UTP-ammonia lyase)